MSWLVFTTVMSNGVSKCTFYQVYPLACNSLMWHKLLFLLYVWLYYKEVDYEVEMAVVIGKQGKKIQVSLHLPTGDANCESLQSLPFVKELLEKL